MKYSKDKFILKQLLKIINDKVIPVTHQSSFNELRDDEIASDDAIIVLQFLITSRKISDLNKFIIDISKKLQSLKDIKRDLQMFEQMEKDLQMCEWTKKDFLRHKEIKEELMEDVEMYEDMEDDLSDNLIELEYLNEHHKNLKEKLKLTSIRGVDISLDCDGNITIKEYAIPKNNMTRSVSNTDK